MVSSAFPEATHTGVEILRKVDIAIDAAHATAMVLGTCKP